VEEKETGVRGGEREERRQSSPLLPPAFHKLTASILEAMVVVNDCRVVGCGV